MILLYKFRFLDLNYNVLQYRRWHQGIIIKSWFVNSADEQPKHNINIK